jgi:hypothetical protein
MKAEALRIRVTDTGQTRVDLTFDAEAAGRLPQLVPPRFRAQLEAGAIDLEAVSASARARNFAPGALFTLDDGPRQIAGWLE